MLNCSLAVADFSMVHVVFSTPYCAVSMHACGMEHVVLACMPVSTVFVYHVCAHLSALSS